MATRERAIPKKACRLANDKNPRLINNANPDISDYTDSSAHTVHDIYHEVRGVP
jgi:hypothetical protein